MQTKDIKQLINGLLSDDFPFQLCGLAVTNPFKIAAMELADELDSTAERTGAVNTLKISDGRIIGFNTDVPGFINPLRRRVSDLEGAHVAVIGTGGASRAAVAALLGEGCLVKVFGRDEKKLEAIRNWFGVETAELSGASFDGFRVVVNATPLGTAGSMNQMTVAESTQLEGAELAYDLVYNPRETLFLKEARSAGCKTLGGLEMLVDQAMQQQRIWTDGTGNRDSLLALLSV
jgi:shikimate dehydrogenase